jgi:hypothetical protein
MTLLSSSITITFTFTFAFLRGALVAAAAIGAVIAAVVVGLEAPAIADTLARKLTGSDASMVACYDKPATLSLRRVRPTSVADKFCINRQVAAWNAVD